MEAVSGKKSIPILITALNGTRCNRVCQCKNCSKISFLAINAYQPWHAQYVALLNKLNVSLASVKQN